MRLNEDGRTVRAMDILFPGIGEIVGGSQREERHDVLVQKDEVIWIFRRKSFGGTWRLAKFGSCVHSGFRSRL